MSQVSFNNKQNQFFSEIKERVNQYFRDNELAKSGGKKLIVKSIIQVTSFLILYTTLVFFHPGYLVSIILCSLLGLNIAVIGFNIMHEGGHQSLSSRPWINTLGAYILNVMGGNIYFWKVKHNINHHTFTNIEGMDSDIDIQPLMRLHKDQRHYGIHRFQHLYCLFLYGISYLSWIFKDDFIKYFTGRIAEGTTKKLEFKEHVIFWFTKLLYVFSFIVLPAMMIGIVPAILGFIIVNFVCGLSIAMVFQLAHVVEATSFPRVTAEEPTHIEVNWAIHQISTTANFDTSNKVMSWLLGGLNFQVEHHLFPRISHVHYPKINEFVKEACIRYQINYIEYASIFHAISSHFSHIRAMGKVN